MRAGRLEPVGGLKDAHHLNIPVPKVTKRRTDVRSTDPPPEDSRDDSDTISLSQYPEVVHAYTDHVQLCVTAEGSKGHTHSQQRKLSSIPLP